MTRRSFGASQVLALALAAPALLAGPAPTPVPAPKPKLAVVISVDGLSYARLESYRPLYTSGLKRLLDEGFALRAARYQHLNTETGPGHASLGTGAPPRVTGIVLNSWFQPGPGGGLVNVYCTDQKDATGKKIAGPDNLRVPTLGDRLVEKTPASRVVSVSAIRAMPASCCRLATSRAVHCGGRLRCLRSDSACFSRVVRGRTGRSS